MALALLLGLAFGMAGLGLSPVHACLPATFEDLYFSTIKGFPSNEVTVVTVDPQGTVYVGTEDQGLIVLQEAPPGTEKWTWWNPDEARQFLKGAIHSLAIDGENTLWVGTTAGLFRVGIGELQNRSVSGTSFQAEDGLKDNVCLSIAQMEGNSALWVGTTRGLIVKEAGFQRFTDEQGLPANLIQALAFDRQNTLWIGTSLGLARRSGFEIQKVALGSSSAELSHWVYGIAGLSDVPGSVRQEKQKFDDLVAATFDGLIEGLRRRNQDQNPLRIGSDIEKVIATQKAGKNRFQQNQTGSHFFVATNQGLYKVSSGSDAVQPLLNGWYTGLAIDEIGSCFAADTSLVVQSAEPGVGLEISYNVKNLIRGSIFSLVASAEVEVYEAQQRSESASLTREMNQLLTQSGEERADWIEKWLDGKRVSSMVFNRIGQLWVGVKGGGVFRFNPVVVNHDAFAYALKFFNDARSLKEPGRAPASGFALSTEPRKERIPPQVRQGVAICAQVNPRAENYWVGRWSDLSVEEAGRLALLLGEFGHPACVSRFTGLVVHNPWVIIPRGDI